MAQKLPAPPLVQPLRTPAPHVQAALARAAQAKLPERSPLPLQPSQQSCRPQAEHVRRALAPAQAKLPDPPSPGRPQIQQAKHMQAAVASLQKKVPIAPPFCAAPPALSIKSPAAPRALQGKLEHQGLHSNVVQPDSLDWDVNAKDPGEGSWMIQQANNEVRIEYAGTLWSIPPHPLHNTTFGGFGNELEGGFTIIYGRRRTVTHEFSRTYRKTPKTGRDTEIQLIGDIEDPIQRMLGDRDAIGVVIEINQKQSICSGCQAALVAFVRTLKARTGKKVIIRARAEQRYESRGGRLLAGMQRLQHHGGDAEDFVPHMDANPDGWIGVHNYVAPAT